MATPPWCVGISEGARKAEEMDGAAGAWEDDYPAHQAMVRMTPGAGLRLEALSESNLQVQFLCSSWPFTIL